MYGSSPFGAAPYGGTLVTTVGGGSAAALMLLRVASFLLALLAS